MACNLQCAADVIVLRLVIGCSVTSHPNELQILLIFDVPSSLYAKAREAPNNKVVATFNVFSFKAIFEDVELIVSIWDNLLIRQLQK